MIVYPMVGTAFGLSDHAIGVFFGATIHDVAQIVGAGYSVSDVAGSTATFVKLLRVALLVPVVVTLSLCFARYPGASRDGKLPIPFFVLGSAALVLVGSTDLIPQAVTATLLELSRWCLVTAITALGMKTSLRKLAEVGPRAIAIVCGLTVLLAGFALTAILALHICPRRKDRTHVHRHAHLYAEEWRCPQVPQALQVGRPCSADPDSGPDDGLLFHRHRVAEPDRPHVGL